jgi:hypothetical protein
MRADGWFVEAAFAGAAKLAPLSALTLIDDP